MDNTSGPHTWHHQSRSISPPQRHGNNHHWHVDEEGLDNISQEASWTTDSGLFSGKIMRVSRCTSMQKAAVPTNIIKTAVGWKSHSHTPYDSRIPMDIMRRLHATRTSADDRDVDRDDGDL
jgi:hypothetical protein